MGKKKKKKKNDIAVVLIERGKFWNATKVITQ